MIRCFRGFFNLKMILFGSYVSAKLLLIIISHTFSSSICLFVRSRIIIHTRQTYTQRLSSRKIWQNSLFYCSKSTLLIPRYSDFTQGEPILRWFWHIIFNVGLMNFMDHILLKTYSNPILIFGCLFLWVCIFYLL